MDKYKPEALIGEGDWVAYFSVDNYDVYLLYAGLLLLVAALLPKLLSKYTLSAPIVYLVLGYSFFLLPINIERPDLIADIWWVKKLSEFTVVISLTSAALKLKNPFKRITWKYSWRLLAFTMPLTMLITFALGYWIFGFALASAILIAAVVAPTDPVLANEVQTSAPHEEDSSPTRLALTSEAGVNDGLAFPFTYLAIGVAILGTGSIEWVWSWFLMDVLYKIGVAVLIGAGLGWGIAKLLFNVIGASKSSGLTTGILTISLTLIPYAAAQIAVSYGFIAVFIAAAVFKNSEEQHEYQQFLHDFSEEIERVLVAAIFILIGGYISFSYFNDFDWYLAIFALILILAVRPVCGYLGLLGTDLKKRQKFTMSFYGIRGVGSLYYVSYAIYSADFEREKDMLLLVIFLMIASVFIHGISAVYAVRYTAKVE